MESMYEMAAKEFAVPTAPFMCSLKDGRKTNKEKALKCKILIASLKVSAITEPRRKLSKILTRSYIGVN